VDVFAIRTRNWQPSWLRASRNQQRTVVEFLAALQRHDAAAGVHAGCAIAYRKLDVHFAIERFVAQRDPLLGRVASEVILGQVRPIHWSRRLVRDQRDGTFVTETPQVLRARRTGSAASDDDDAGRR
jgi:hypothetical protein